MGKWNIFRVNVPATARGMKLPILTVAPIIPMTMVATVWAIPAILAPSASPPPPSSGMGGGGGRTEAMAAVIKSAGLISKPI
ncbi:MAG: hypothetical protein HXN55_07395 [Prevotella nigrescens]|uniref:Uncharacterized protein n=2 Tax=Prevotella nigrescens TaxID=28133 RepID=A0A9D6AA80_9BACT|nr:hypothetical protein [Hoylesella timonensis]MBF1447186.1 hypothetical protein [Prevotella nigrescens]